jgi:hypothetical protein
LLNFCFVGIRLSDQIKDDVQKAGVAEVPEINVLIEHMSSYIINSRSDNISKSYYYSFNRWSTFAFGHPNGYLQNRNLTIINNEFMARNAKLEN